MALRVQKTILDNKLEEKVGNFWKLRTFNIVSLPDGSVTTIINLDFWADEIEANDKSKSSISSFSFKAPVALTTKQACYDWLKANVAGFSAAEITDDAAPFTPSPDQIVAAKVQELRKVSMLIIDEFIKENILLGIEQRGLTEQVLNVAGPVMVAIQGLSLKVAVNRLKEIDPASFDGVILNEARLKKFRNKIEAVLGVPLAAEWNSPPTW